MRPASRHGNQALASARAPDLPGSEQRTLIPNISHLNVRVFSLSCAHGSPPAFRSQPRLSPSRRRPAPGLRRPAAFQPPVLRCARRGAVRGQVCSTRYELRSPYECGPLDWACGHTQTGAAPARQRLFRRQCLFRHCRRLRQAPPLPAVPVAVGGGAACAAAHGRGKVWCAAAGLAADCRGILGCRLTVKKGTREARGVESRRR